MPYTVSQQPGTPGWGDYFGQAAQDTTTKLQDFLLKAILEGQLGQVSQQTVQPTGNIQNLPLSGGRQFSGTPQAAQRMIPDYIKQLQGQVNQGTLQTTGLPSGFSATPTGKSSWRMQPNLTRQTQQADLRLKNAQAGAWETGKPLIDASGNVIGRVPPNAMAAPGASQEAGLLDKSYTVHDTQLNKLQEPLDARISRLSTLQDTLNQHTMQADALVAPELLTVMAGGPQSGLRMTEAEIARIVGGRTHLEDLKAALSKFETDPNHAFSITPDQRNQVRALVQTVNQKLTAKVNILNASRQQLIDASSKEDHRKILADTHKALQAVDAETGQGRVEVGNLQEGQVQEGQTATNPQTGQKLTFRGGRWQ